MIKYLIIIPFLSFGQFIPIDKQKHFVAGSVVSIPSIVTDRTIVHAIIFSAAAGVAKEIHDPVFDKRDVMFTIAGGLVTGIVINQIKKRKKRLHKG